MNRVPHNNVSVALFIINQQILLDANKLFTSIHSNSMHIFIFLLILLLLLLLLLLFIFYIYG